MLKELCRDKKKKYIVFLLIAGSFLAALKCIFVSLQMDEEYAVSLSYRLLRGDRLFAQIWDPHQTSAFLMEFLMWVYIKLFHTTTGVVVWVRLAGVLIQLGISCYLYRVLCYILEPEHSFYLAAIYFNLLPKTYVMPEFSNMMTWGVTLLLLSLFRLAKLQGRIPGKGKDDLWTEGISWGRKMAFAAVEAGVWLSFTVLSYPSCLLLFPFLLWYLARYDAFKKKTISIFAGTCIVLGSVYMAYLFSYMSLSELLANIRSLIASNGYHSTGILGKCQIYAGNLLPLLLFGTGYLLAAVIVYKIYRGIKGRLTFFYILLMASFALMFLHWILMLWEYERSYPYTVYFFLFGIAFYCVEKLPENVKEMAKLWLGANVVMYVAILMLTNLTLFTSIKYLLTGVVMSAAVLLICTKEREPEVFQKFAGWFLIVWCFVAVFIKGWAYTDNDGLMKNITCVGNIISVGPGKGIVTEYMQGYMAECSREEFQTYIEPGESLLALDTNTICYMYQDVNIGSCTTICTPTFDETLLDYWKRNPDKYPDVIAVMCWYGELQWDQDSWIMHWIEEEFGATQVIDGKYFRYYIRRP